MTQDEIIRMAREACNPQSVDPIMGEMATFTLTELERFAALVAAREREKLKNVAIFSRWYEELDKAVLAEREACAKVCDEIFRKCVDDFEAGAADECAAAIRARGDK